jgi:hypothetical protein
MAEQIGMTRQGVQKALSDDGNLAEMERELTVEMTRAGLEVARLWYDLSSVDVWRFYDGCYIPYFVR